MSRQLTVLKNGLRVLTDRVESVESVAIGVWVDVGTRNEDLKDNGVAHMVEHMMFNGTHKRSAQDIVAQIENVGGQMNAYTSRENTAYYIHLLKEDVGLAMDVLSDMIQHSTFPDSEIEKERRVIIQEIGMCADTPDDVVFDLYQEKAYPQQSLGAPILGTSDIIEVMSKEVLQGYVQQFYTAENLVLSVSGNVSHDEIVTLAQRYFMDLPTSKIKKPQAARYEGGCNIVEKQLEQAHVVLGFRGIDKFDPTYYSAALLSTVLGGGMSSRLFQSVREQHGLAYSVYASHTAFKDDGQFEIYVGTDPDKLSKLMPVLSDEIQKITQEAISADELTRAKSQIKSSLLMGQESMLSRANRQAKHLISFNEIVDIHQIIEKIDSVNVANIQGMAQKIFSSQSTLAALGPLADMPDYGEITKRLAA